MIRRLHGPEHVAEDESVVSSLLFSFFLLLLLPPASPCSSVDVSKRMAAECVARLSHEVLMRFS